MAQEQVYTVNEATAILKVSRATLYRMMDSGQLKYVIVGKRRRIPKSVLDAMIQLQPEVNAPEVSEKYARTPALAVA